MLLWLMNMGLAGSPYVVPQIGYLGLETTDGYLLLTIVE